MLCDLGAEVIKIERAAGGDPGRSLVSADGYQYYNQAFNRGKRSLALDIRRPESRAILEKLVQVIPTPSHLLDRISPISPPFFPEPRAKKQPAQVSKQQATPFQRPG